MQCRCVVISSFKTVSQRGSPTNSFWRSHLEFHSCLYNSYCVPSLLYACEIWSLSDSNAHSVRVALNNLFRRIFNRCWLENPKSLLFYCGTLPALYTVDQRRILFYKKLKFHSSILIRTIAKLCQHDILSVSAKYGINRLDNSVFSIKKSMWQTFAATVV